MMDVRLAPGIAGQLTSEEVLAQGVKTALPLIFTLSPSAARCHATGGLNAAATQSNTHTSTYTNIFTKDGIHAQRENACMNVFTCTPLWLVKQKRLIKSASFSPYAAVLVVKTFFFTVCNDPGCLTFYHFVKPSTHLFSLYSSISFILLNKQTALFWRRHKTCHVIMHTCLKFALLMTETVVSFWLGQFCYKVIK